MSHPEGPWRQSVFDHRQHVKFTWTVLGEHPFDEATAVVAEEIRDFAATHAPGRYHETITRFWIGLVAHTRAVAGDENDFAAHLGRFPVLMDKSAPRKHYSEGVLFSPDARSDFVQPDLRPLP